MPTYAAILAAEADIRSRLQWAIQCGERLGESIQTWHRDNVGVATTIADDRLSWEVRWSIQNPPPEEWGRVFADGIHNLRSALDNLLHAIAVEHGADDKGLTNVQFPVVDDPEKWPAERPHWRVAMLPPRVQAVVRSVQPFNRLEEERATDGLVILSRLNNVEKHRVMLRSTMSWLEISHSFSVSFEEGGPSDAGPPRVEVFGNLPSDGALILRHDTAPDRIDKVKGDFAGKIQVVVADTSGTEHGATVVLDALIRYVELVLANVVYSWAETKV